LQRRVVWQDILAWIEGGPLPSGHGASCSGEAPPVTASAG
jgi:hypothetical protein